jgi:hypothetical protein
MTDEVFDCSDMIPQGIRKAQLTSDQTRDSLPQSAIESFDNIGIYCLLGADLMLF